MSLRLGEHIVDSLLAGVICVAYLTQVRIGHVNQ